MSYLDSLGKEEILSKIASKGLKSPLVIQKLLPHESRHAGGTVDPKQVTVEVHPGVECSKEDFLQRGGKTSTITDIWQNEGMNYKLLVGRSLTGHLVNQTHRFSHTGHHVQQGVLPH